MRLKTKLVLSITALMFAIVTVLSSMFVGELLRQRVEQTVATNDVLVREVLLMTRQAVETGMRANPPADASPEAFHAALVSSLRSQTALIDVMKAIVLYSPTVQDVTVTDATGTTIVSTDPDTLDQKLPPRQSLLAVQNGGVPFQIRQVFGAPRVLDITQTLDNNGKPFLIVHVGVLSTFLKNSYAPWLRASAIFAVVAGLISVLMAALMANAALSPIEFISKRLESLTRTVEDEPVFDPEADEEEEERRSTADTVARVSRSLDRLGEKMRTQEAGYTALQANLNQMLDTLRDGVLLFTADRRAVMVSDAAAFFLDNPQQQKMVGLSLEEIFQPHTPLGDAVLEAFAEGGNVAGRQVTLEGGRQVQISIDAIDNGLGGDNMGTLVTLRDMESAEQIGQEIEVSRRLAAIGRLTAGVGHEVKNPINAMVVHLELLRTKLAAENGTGEAAQRHVDILAGEMQRLDRVVQTLADFTRPMELSLREKDLRQVIWDVTELMSGEMEENGVQVTVNAPPDPVPVRIDAEMIQQALLNLVLNGMQAMPDGGGMQIRLRKEHHFAVVEVSDEGIGIPPELLPRIFELYFTTKPKGSGIGLAMTYRILQLHGGAMEVRSTTDPSSPDRGTIFTFRIPLLEGRKAVGAAATTAIAGSSHQIREQA